MQEEALTAKPADARGKPADENCQHLGCGCGATLPAPTHLHRSCSKSHDLTNAVHLPVKQACHSRVIYATAQMRGLDMAYIGTTVPATVLHMRVATGLLEAIARRSMHVSDRLLAGV